MPLRDRLERLLYKSVPLKVNKRSYSPTRQTPICITMRNANDLELITSLRDHFNTPIHPICSLLKEGRCIFVKITHDKRCIIWETLRKNVAEGYCNCEATFYSKIPWNASKSPLNVWRQVWSTLQAVVSIDSLENASETQLIPTIEAGFTSILNANSPS